MIEERIRFYTDVAGIWGHWPNTPTLWSYSSLREIETCPQRWMLSRADYPDIWERRGYPPLPVAAAVFGSVVHSVIEHLTNTLRDAGTTSSSGGEVIGVLKSLGGWREIVLAAIETELARLDANPRVSAQSVDRIRSELARRAPEAADQVKAFLHRGVLPNGTVHSSKWADTDGPRRRSPARPGAHAERVVTSESLRVTGTIDQLVVDDVNVIVTDFKTGIQDDIHDEQVRLYALLWSLDEQTNPDGRPATQLRLVYPSFERSVDAPDEEQLDELEAETAARVATADRITVTPPPTAFPSEETCQYCQVKHLCGPYWLSVPPAVSTVSSEEWFDFEGSVLRPNGSRSWIFATLSHQRTEILVRTVETDVPFPAGKRVRLLGVRRNRDPDKPERLVISMVATSEWYSVDT
ncbi:PD-(D/E)XK nuclease family protein [Gordonia sp. ABSL11-1]|uniref:RecB family exonuclease n=1 Tax=Gordonia sp. ABSL11-1 TaxID=3053924 RepID=UPI002572EB9E|nr:PD-(D/E)XK nuclease family protein [Gordonia sp. ABSL11-1]MDL9947326.1 PD-(D/E)XK nuclease family protein [Gordonia sp. ABSL11-1]